MSSMSKGGAESRGMSSVPVAQPKYQTKSGQKKFGNFKDYGMKSQPVRKVDAPGGAENTAYNEGAIKKSRSNSKTSEGLQSNYSIPSKKQVKPWANN